MTAAQDCPHATRPAPVVATMGLRRDERMPILYDRPGGLICAAASPEKPFLGVPLARKMGKRLTVGPNAVLVMTRKEDARTDLSIRNASAPAATAALWMAAA